MSVLTLKAQEIVAEIPTNGTAATGDRPILDFILELLPKLLPLLMGCLPMAKQNAGGMSAALQSPNLRQRLGLRYHLRRNMDDPRTGTAKLWEVEEAMYKVGRTVDEPVAAALIAELN